MVREEWVECVKLAQQLGATMSKSFHAGTVIAASDLPPDLDAGDEIRHGVEGGGVGPGAGSSAGGGGSRAGSNTAEPAPTGTDMASLQARLAALRK